MREPTPGIIERTASLIASAAQAPRRQTRRVHVVLASFCLIATANADEFVLRTGLGQCEHNYMPQQQERRTTCVAEAYVTNVSTSETFICRAEVEGDQYVAPSVPETAPEAIVCTRIGQPFERKGTYDLTPAQDPAAGHPNVNRIRGRFGWSNAFWMLSRNSLDVTFCARRLAESSPDYRMRCSRKVDWRK